MRTFEISVESGGSAIGHFVEGDDARDALRRLLAGDFTGIDAEGRSTIIVSPADEDDDDEDWS